MFRNSSDYAICLFIGLIAGTLPMLFKSAGAEGRTKGSWLTFICCFLVLLAMFLLLQTQTSLSIEPNIWWYLFCGIVWGASIVVPGMSSSSILIFLGLYQPMTKGISALDFGVLLPLVAGLLITALVFARFVNRLYERHYAIASHATLGFVVASTIAIIPTSYASTGSALLCLAFAVAGFFVAWGMDKWGEKLKKKNPELE